ncbi:MAG: HDOD domain-containing protein [Planctomycetes bacterium]|nr:HDOD domain-containing protein [Planctomycetota bacterium]
MSSRVEPVAALSDRDRARDLRHLRMLQTFLEKRLTYLCGWSVCGEATAVGIGRVAGLDDESLASLATAASFHDLGLLAIPDALLDSNRELTPEERETVSQHVRYGGQLLHLVYRDQPDIMDAVWFHHERPDGKGPLGLTGDLIPLSAKITSVSDAIVSMHTGRPYRTRRSPDEILKDLADGAGTQFDEGIVRAVHRARVEVFRALTTATKAADAGGSPVGGRRAGVAVASSVGAAAAPQRPGEIAARLENVEQISALPTPVCEVIALASNSDTDRSTLAKAVKQDVALVGKLLAVANSPIYRRTPRRITAIDDAIGALGFSNVASVAVGMSVLRSPQSDDQATALFVKTWRHSLSCGLIARALSANEGQETQEARFLHGLMHDLGKFIVAECFPEYTDALASSRDPQAERDVLGTDHARLGARMLSRWDMPADPIRAVREHHCTWDSPRRWTPEETRGVLAVQLADALATALGFDSGFLDYFPRIPAHVLDHFPSIHSVEITEVARMVDAHLQEMGALLGVGWARPTGAAWMDGAETDPQPPAIHISPEQPAWSALALWLQYAQGRAVQFHDLNTPLESIDPQALILIDLPEPRPDDVDLSGLKTLLEQRSGILIAADCWLGDVEEPAGARWQSVPASLPVAALEDALTQAVGEQP